MTATDQVIARARASRARAARARNRAAATAARALFEEDLRTAHRAGAHQGPDGIEDPSGYWTEIGCPACEARP